MLEAERIGQGAVCKQESIAAAQACRDGNKNFFRAEFQVLKKSNEVPQVQRKPQAHRTENKNRTSVSSIA